MNRCIKEMLCFPFTCAAPLWLNTWKVAHYILISCFVVFLGAVWSYSWQKLINLAFPQRLWKDHTNCSLFLKDFWLSCHFTEIPHRSYSFPWAYPTGMQICCCYQSYRVGLWCCASHSSCHRSLSDHSSQAHLPNWTNTVVDIKVWLIKKNYLTD